MIKKIVLSIILTAFLTTSVFAKTETLDVDEFLDKVQKQAFGYFWDETNPYTGLTSNTTEPGMPASNAAAGFMLSALIIGIERGWITKDEGYERALATLKAFEKIEKFHGFTYHYFNKNTGKRMWTGEVSCLDTGLFLCGAIAIGEYFKGTEVEELADGLFRNTNWQWFLNGENVLQMAWKPEEGFFARVDTFSEGILCYILAMGSPSYPIPSECWDAFARPVGEYAGYKMIYARNGSLFQYLFPLVWFDLKDKHDKYADYWQNAIKAVKANRQFCRNNAASYKTYAEGFWGLSACLSAGGYMVFGGKPGKNIHDGTVTPHAVGGSIPLTPEFSIEEYWVMYMRVPEAVGKYGLTDAFNLDRKWASRDYISIDKGLTLLMIENYRTGLIWKYFMQNKYVKAGMKKAGFEPGRQDEPSKLVTLAGNPYDTLEIKPIDYSIKVDGNLSEWQGAPQIVLTGDGTKHVELTLGFVKNDADVSGVFYLGWDTDNLYLAGKIRDNEIVCEEEDRNIYLDDCVEIFFDTNKNGYNFDINAYDYQLGIAPYGPGKESQIWAWGYRNRVPRNIDYAVRMLEDGYTFEAKIPFSEVNNFGPDAERETGFSISIHDKDSDGKTKKLTWSIDSTSQPGKIFFGTLVLAE
ncbi:glucoamylase family protein [Candidatus Omnitrophota bacterium]